MAAPFWPLRTLSPRLRRDIGAATSRRKLLTAANGVDWGARQLLLARERWADAVADVPHYSSLVARGEAPLEIGSWSDFRQIPVLTRRQLQDRPADFIRLSGRPDDFSSTAGSTGTPLRIGVSQSERGLMRVVKLAEWQAFGYTPDARLFVMWGPSYALGSGWRGSVAHFKRQAADCALGYHRVNAYRLSKETCETFAEELIRFRPVGVIGYAAALDLFARYTQAYASRFQALRLRFILTTSEPPPRGDSVAMLSHLFGCPVVQEYGGVDFGQVAFKAADAPFDVYSDLNYVECETADPTPEAHAVLLTSLYPRYVPLIRYRNADTLLNPVRLSHGHVTRFEAVGGRLNDTFALANGDSVYSLGILHAVHQEAAVYNVQMVLADEGMDLNLVTGEADRHALEARILSRLTKVHPLLAAVRIRYVDDVLATRAGKRRWIVDRRTNRPCAG